MTGLVLLDRDGVINEDTPEGISHPNQLVLIDGAAQAIAMLNQAQYQVAVITNQSVVGKGLTNTAGLEAIHQQMQYMLAQSGAKLDAIYWCGDHPDAPTHRRKPAPGMLEEALRDFGACAEETPMVGDALRDLQAAHAIGCPRHLVRTGKGAKTEQDAGLKSLMPVQIHADLSAFVTYLLRSQPQMA